MKICSWIDGLANRAFMMGLHKAYQFARTLTWYDAAVSSDMRADAIKKAA
jgi:hypothetical protein